MSTGLVQGHCPIEGACGWSPGRDALEEGSGIVGYHALIWLLFETRNLFIEVLGVSDMVWGVDNHGSQDGGQVFFYVVCDTIDATCYLSEWGVPCLSTLGNP